MFDKHPSTIFTDQSDVISVAIRIIFLNTRHHFCSWLIFNVAKVISDHPKFLARFKKYVYEESFVVCFNKRRYDLSKTYKLRKNLWLNNLYELQVHWAAADSFTTLTITQKSDFTIIYFTYKYWSCLLGLLCKHALWVPNINKVLSCHLNI